ncbi:hypothetical protein HHL28_06625 [Aerophototrophica crusticola]|uniref:DUF4412 domain-containing protein n=1 Tax=Aerophototrophica crusticola TaxID=1709002 RepID=A0A858R616_9PROT|nr:hypothetical protein HHL28_06625 [Rhodospirillaceae bacterium B3]
MRLPLILSAAALSLASPALAAKLPPLRAEYAAVQTLVVNSAKTEAKLAHSRGKERRETTVDGLANLLLLRPDKAKAWVVQPESGMAMELTPMDPEIGIDPSALATLEGEPAGKEKVAGLDTVKYRVQDVFAEGGGFDGHVWSTEDGIYAKVEGTATDGGEPVAVRMELREVKRGRQDPALFELPAGVRLMDMGTLPDRVPAPPATPGKP